MSLINRTMSIAFSIAIALDERREIDCRSCAWLGRWVAEVDRYTYLQLPVNLLTELTGHKELKNEREIH